MPGVLNFTLGLETSNFLHSIGASSRGLLEFIGGVESIGKAWEKTWAAIEQGAGFQAMAHRARETVGAMYELSAGLASVGVDGGSATQMATRIQRALSGVTDEGENTAAIFSRLGLSLNALRGQDAAHQVQTIAEALAKIDKNAQASFAQKLFGREGAGNILQISAALNEFNAGMKDAAGDATVWERVSKLFEHLEVQSKQIAAHFKTLWAGIAEGAAPAIMDIEAQLQKINFADIGKHLGDILNEFYGAFKSGELSTVIVASFDAAFNVVLDLAPPFFAELADIMATTFGARLRGGARKALGFDDVSEDDLGALPAAAGGLTHAKINADKNLSAEQKARMHAALDASVKSQAAGEAGIDAAVKGDHRAALDAAMAKGAKDAAEHLKAFSAMLEKFHITVAGFTADPNADTKGKPVDPGVDLPYKAQFTDLEKIGLILPGLGNPVKDEVQKNIRDYTRRIADNTTLLLQDKPRQLDNFGLTNRPL